MPIRVVLFRNSAFAFIGDALSLPFGLLIVSYLARRLEPREFGLLAVMLAGLAWIEASLGALFGRVCVKSLMDAPPDRAALESAVLWLFAGLGVVLGTGFALAGGVLEGLAAGGQSLRLPLIAALSIPVVSAMIAHRVILYARSEFRSRPILNGIRWGGRTALTFLLVEWGWGAEGALWALVGGSLLELGAARLWVRPAFHRIPLISPLFAKGIWPVLAASLAMRLTDRVDLFLLTAIDADVRLAGVYGAALNLALVFTFASVAIGTSLYGNAHRLHEEGRLGEIPDQIRAAFRWTHWMLPPLGIAAGAAPEITRLLLGPSFHPASEVLPLLCGAAVLHSVLQVSLSVLTALRRSGALLILTLPLPVLAGTLMWTFIRRWGFSGAAWGAFALACLTSCLSLGILLRQARFVFPWTSLLRCGGVALAAYAGSHSWPCREGWVVLKILLLMLTAAALLAALGEFKSEPSVEGASGAPDLPN